MASRRHDGYRPALLLWLQWMLFCVNMGFSWLLWSRAFDAGSLRWFYLLLYTVVFLFIGVPTLYLLETPYKKNWKKLNARKRAMLVITAIGGLMMFAFLTQSNQWAGAVAAGTNILWLIPALAIRKSYKTCYRRSEFLPNNGFRRLEDGSVFGWLAAAVYLTGLAAVHIAGGMWMTAAATGIVFVLLWLILNRRHGFVGEYRIVSGGRAMAVDLLCMALGLCVWVFAHIIQEAPPYIPDVIAGLWQPIFAAAAILLTVPCAFTNKRIRKSYFKAKRVAAVEKKREQEEQQRQQRVAAQYAAYERSRHEARTVRAGHEGNSYFR